MASTIPLAKSFNPGKMGYPAMVSEKLDGVPIKITMNCHEYGHVSRSDKPVVSVDWLVSDIWDVLRHHIGRDNITIIGELTHPDFPAFKDLSGVVRRQERNSGLILNVFDFCEDGWESVPFFTRIQCFMKIAMKELIDVPAVKVIHQVICNNASEVSGIVRNTPDWQEGWIVRDCNAEFKPGSRHWDYQKHVVDPVLDLRITGFEEAVSKDGEPLGMVGKLYADFKGEQIGIGPGKLTHAERKALFDDRSWVGTDRFAAVQYKKDDSYTALRQPTFQHWTDKTEPNYEGH